jgi:hypothetical protein
LHGVAAIPVRLPQDAFGVGDIGNRLAVFGVGEPLGGDASQEGLELFGLRSNRESSLRGDKPSANILLPSLLGTSLRSFGSSIACASPEGSSETSTLPIKRYPTVATVSM